MNASNSRCGVHNKMEMVALMGLDQNTSSHDSVSERQAWEMEFRTLYTGVSFTNSVDPSCICGNGRSVPY